MSSALPWRRIESILVVLIALHSYAIGVVLVFLTEWGLRLGGFTEPGTIFFARQGGAFHFVVATAYLLEHRRHGTINLLLLAKGIAVVFLAGVTLLSDVPPAIPLSGFADLLMAVVALWVHTRVARSQGA